MVLHSCHLLTLSLLCLLSDQAFAPCQLGSGPLGSPTGRPPSIQGETDSKQVQHYAFCLICPELQVTLTRRRHSKEQQAAETKGGLVRDI